MSVPGQVVEVQVNDRGASLVADVATGDTSVTVDRVTPFDPNGRVLIDGNVYDYTTVTEVPAPSDPDGNPGVYGVLTLSSGLLGDVLANMPVAMWLGNADDGQVPSDVVLLVDTFTEGADFVPAAPSDDRSNWTAYAGPIDPPIPGALSDDLTTFTRDPAYQPVISLEGGVVGLPDIGVDPTDPPTESPTPTVYADSGAAVVTWEPPADTRTRIRLYVTTANSDGTVNASAPVDSTTLYADDVSGAQWLSSIVPGGAPIDPGAVYQFALVAYNVVDAAPPSPWVLGTAGVIHPFLIADTAIIRALTTVDLSTTTLRSVNLEGGSIAIAITTAASLTEEFTGTALPGSWPSYRSGSASVPGVSVVNSGAPSGVNGSALLIDYGDGSQTAQAQGRVVMGAPSVIDGVATIRFRTLRPPSMYDTFGVPIFRLALRAQAGGSASAATYIGLDLATGTGGFALLSRIGNSDSFLASVPYLDTSAQWTIAELRAVSGQIQARVYADGSTPTSWTTSQQAGVLAAGEAALCWVSNPGLGSFPSPDQKVWVDRGNVVTYSTGFKVNPDGTGTPTDLAERLATVESKNTTQDTAIAANRARTQAGKASVNIAAVNTVYPVDVTFSPPFAVAPIIGGLNPNTQQPQNVQVSSTAATTTGFTIYARRTAGTGNLDIGWTATAP